MNFILRNGVIMIMINRCQQHIINKEWCYRDSDLVVASSNCTPLIWGRKVKNIKKEKKKDGKKLKKILIQ